jgi:hypothetical protein
VVKIKKIILSGIMALVLVQIVCAVDVGLVVNFPNGTLATECVQIVDGSTGRAAIDASSFSVQYAYGGGFVDGINGVVSDNTNFLYWSVWQDSAGIFGLTSVGVTELIMNREDIVLGFAYGGFDPITFNPVNTPTFIPYNTVCDKKLKITQFKAYVDGDKASGVDEDGGRIKDVKPGSEVQLKIEVSNLYDRSEDIEIEDVLVSAMIDEIDDGDEIEEESEEYDIDANDEENIELIFNIPLRVDEDNYDMIITLEGDEESGWKYEETIELELELDKENHELMILDAEIAPSTVRCDRTSRLDFRIINIGSNDEDVNLRIENEALGINIEDEFELSEDPDDDDNEYRKEFVIKIDESAAAGSYPLKVIAEYGSLEESESIDLEIENCGDTFQQQEGVTEHQGLPPGYSYTPQVSQTQLTQDKPKSWFSNNSTWVIILAEVLAVAIGVIVFLAVKR